MNRLVAATRNAGKLRELSSLLSVAGVTVVGAHELPGAPEVEETGATFEENARLKARALRDYSGLPSLADDSGLCVDALGGAPGVHSARFGAPQAVTSADRNELLLRRLERVPEELRGAHFACAMVLCWPDGREFSSWGEVHGRIAFEAEGSQGFGYDPIFLLPDRGVTMAALSQDEKNQISHRGQALRIMIPILEKLFREKP